jgi:hypothetical protein
VYRLVTPVDQYPGWSPELEIADGRQPTRAIGVERPWGQHLGRGRRPGNFSPTSLVAQYLATGADPHGSLSTTQYTLSGSDGANWQTLDSTLNLSLTPGANGNALLGGNADLFTDTSGFNQDLGIFVSDNGGADNLLAWKESGGFAGTFSPNAAFAQALSP